MASESRSLWKRLAELFGARAPAHVENPFVSDVPEEGGRRLVGQHISEIRDTATANGWVEDPLLTFTTERGAWPLRFETDDAGIVTVAAWAERIPDPEELLAERLVAAWMQRIDPPCDLRGLGSLADVAVEVFNEWLKNPPVERVGE